MRNSNGSSEFIRFGVFEVDVRARELRKGGLRIRLQQQPFQVLLALLEKPGSVVTREELQRNLWSPDTFVDFEQGLGTAIRKLREALGDSAESPRFIETLPKRGYRFIAPVSPAAPGSQSTNGALAAALSKAGEVPIGPGDGLESSRPDSIPRNETGNGAPSVAAGASSATLEGQPLKVRLGRWQVIVAAALLLVFAARMGFRRSVPTRQEPPLVDIPLASYPGNKFTPSFSPDGTQIAFAWTKEMENNSHLYVKVIGDESTLRLTDGPSSEFSPAWSPNGRWIAFARAASENKYAVVLISPLGGPERTLTECSCDSDFGFDMESPYLAWTPDSQWLAIVDCDKSGRVPALFLLSLVTGEKRRLTTPLGDRMRDACPAFSPDGRTLAFVRRASLLDSDIHLLDLSPDLKPVAAPRQLTSLHWSVSSPAWTLDGRSLVFSAWPATVNSLWRVDASGLNKPQRLPGVGAGGMHPAISRGGNRLAYARQALDDNIYRLELPTAKGRAKSPQKLIASTYSDYSPQFSPDGKKISFMSDRSGKQEIWVCDSDGSHVTQLTFLDGPLVGYVPEWSPDGQELVFELDQAGHRDIWTVNADGGTLSRVTSGSLNANNPNWSRDGRWVLFDTFTGQLCCQTSKVPAEGGPVARVTTEGGWGPVESPDGKYIYSVGNSPDGPTLVRTPAGGGKTELVIDSIINGDAWTVVEDGIYFVKKPGPGSGYSIQFLNTSTGVVHQIADFERPVWGRLSVSPDRRWILYTQTDQEGSDLMLVENFH